MKDHNFISMTEKYKSEIENDFKEDSIQLFNIDSGMF